MKVLDELRTGGRTLYGLGRSLVTYYGGRRRHRAMDRLYRRFVRPGDLVFDIGSHVGDRVACFRRLGARVVAVEPQPVLAGTLRCLYGRDPQVRIETVAVGASSGEVEFLLNRANPAVSTASEAFVAAAQGAPGWEGQVWDGRIRIVQTTLDALVVRHGDPAFAKIDIEGKEAAALAGLSRPIPALSFEFTTIRRRVALACVAACTRLGPYRFNAALGESQRLILEDWVSAGEIRDWLKTLPDRANSGDVYAAIDVGTRSR
jgi:FkbM family methyltransferase